MRLLGQESPAKPESLEGRTAEQAALGAALADAQRGRGRIVVVSGEAGIGKSALLQALSLQAEAAGVRPVWGRAWEFADAPAYFPVRPCLAALGLPLPAGQAAAPFALWEGVLEALSRASPPLPVLWLLEDLHAADLQTLDLLTFLAQPLRVLPVLIVVSTRQHDPRLDERSEQRLLRMARDGLDLRLRPLAAESVARLAQQHAGELPDATLQELLEVTSGNPLFVVECARSLKARGFGSLRGVSPTIRHVVIERLRQLPEASSALLHGGAVLGRDFTAAMLGRMLGLLPARAIDLLLPALRSGVLLEQAPGSFAFSHVVVQEAIYESLAAEERSSLHAKAQRALEELAETPELLLEKARHALSALTPGTQTAALELCLRAARTLEDSGAFDRAHALYVRLRDKVELGGLTHELQGDALLHMAEVAERAGRSSAARALSLSVLKRARARGDARQFALAALELGRGIRPGLIDDELVVTLRDALAQLGEESSSLACRLRARLAAALQPALDPRQPVKMALDVIERARALGDPALLLEVLDVAGAACVEYAPLAQQLEQAEALLERALGASDFVRTQRARSRLAFQRATLGDFDAYDQHVAEMLRETAVAGQAQARVRPLLMASLGALVRGRSAESAGLIAEARQLLSLTDDPSLGLSFRAHAFGRALLLHFDDELEQYDTELMKLIGSAPQGVLTMHSLRAILRTRLEREAPAREDLLIADAQPGSWVSGFEALLAEAAAFVRHQALCAKARARLLPLAGQDYMGGQVSMTYEGPVDRLLGLLDGALGDFPSGEARLRSALAVLEQRGFSACVAQTRYDLGNLLQAAGRMSDARPLWQAAAEAAASCGMFGLVKRAHARSAGGGALREPARPAPSAPPGLLMVREGELYRLERGATVTRIRATRGAELLARLLDAPDREIHVLALASDEGSATSESHAGDSIDRTALRQYQARLAELRELVAEAELAQALGRLEPLRREQAALEREVARALGLGGRVRQAGSTTERARVNVQRRLKDVLERVSEASPELGQWLGRCLRTGTYCSFRPGA